MTLFVESLEIILCFLYYKFGDKMNIIYRKNTLYVYLKENLDEALAHKIEDRVNNIMGTYNIDNLVIRTNGQNNSILSDFEIRYNNAHNSRMIIK